MELMQLKLYYSNNQQQIFNIERLMNNIVDSKLKTEVEKFKSYENLHCEKITPFTVRLLKGSKNKQSLNSVCNENGDEFFSDSDREKFITNTFSKIYDPTFDDSQVKTGCIEQFLGADLLDHPLIKESKLSEIERGKLEAPLTIFELDKAMEQTNKNLPQAWKA
jgi:hypothetical protein